MIQIINNLTTFFHFIGDDLNNDTLMIRYTLSLLKLSICKTSQLPVSLKWSMLHSDSGSDAWTSHAVLV